MVQSIDSERFILKELTADNASQDYLSWLHNPDTAKYIENCQQEIAELANYIESKYQDKNCLFLGIFTKDKQTHIGNIKYELMADHPYVATMGILIGNTSWHGKGVAGEVLASSFSMVKERLKANKINLGVEISNVAAVKAYEKVGFKLLQNGYYQFDDDAIEMVIDL